MSQSQIIGIADCNSFYCSCERVGAPWLEGKPLVVASNNDGCAVAITPEAKKLNIKRGTPLYQLQDLVREHGVEIRSSNYPLYLDFSNRVMSSIATFVPQYEPYSIDEVFYTLPANEFKGDAATEHARQMRTTVRKWTGIPLSVGLASTKTLSKIANHVAKKQEQYEGVFNIANFPQDDLDTLLEDTPVEDIWGIGIQRGRTLRQNGISNGLQLKQAPDGWIKKHLTIAGLRTVWELRGISCIALEQLPSPRKGMCCAKSFGRPIETLDELKEAVAAYTARLGEKLRGQKLAANTLDIFIHTNRFKQGQPQYSNHYTLRLPLSTNYTPELISYAHFGLEKIFREGYSYQKAGVMLTNLVPEGNLQLSLFEKGEDTLEKVSRQRQLMQAVDEINNHFGKDTLEKVERQRQLMQAVDGINKRFGKDTVIVGSTGLKRDWKMRQAYLSQQFTTSWDELLKVM